ncbi:hypothetical protein DFH06DRAFT_1250145 [Mycena polygramma]|nr:hypothetical protein DFH06DRAFT_1250145 [Mycena polygramma]
MSTAQDAVSSTPELLERILALLPMQNLLVTAPLVSKTWQATTLTPLLQRILFFQPDPTSISEPVQNPLLVAKFPPPFFAQKSGDQSRWSWPSANSIKKLPWAAAPEAFRRRDASWRRMLVRQPPVRSMSVVEMCHAQMGDFERRAELYDLELRMGALYDLVLPLIDRVASSFRIRWHGTVGADLTLDVIFTSQCSDELESLIDEQFYTEWTSNTENDDHIKIKFGKFVQTGGH